MVHLGDAGLMELEKEGINEKSPPAAAQARELKAAGVKALSWSAHAFYVRACASALDGVSPCVGAPVRVSWCAAARATLVTFKVFWLGECLWGG